jgi:regulatory protein
MKAVKKISRSEALDRLMNLCSRTEKSSSDIRKKLHEWGLDEETEKIIDALTKDKYIDDTRYARAFVIDKIRFNKWGVIKVRYLLRSKQISSADITAALSSVDPEEYRRIVFDELTKKRKSLQTGHSYKLKAKLHAFANQRGYETVLINEFIDSSSIT